MAAAAPAPNAEDHTQFNWSGYDTVDEADPTLTAVADLEEEDIRDYAALTRKKVKSSAGKAIRDLLSVDFDTTGWDTTAELRNLLWAIVGLCRTRVQELDADLGHCPIADEERRTIRSNTAEVARIKRRLDGGSAADMNVRPRKRAMLDTSGKNRQLMVGEATVDGTFSLFEAPKNPVRNLFFDEGAFGYRSGSSTPPPNKSVSEYVAVKCTRYYEKAPSGETMNKVINMQLGELDMTQFAMRGFGNVNGDRKALKCALDNFADMVQDIHGETLQRRVREFCAEIRRKSGKHCGMPIMIKYVMLCLKHFVADLVDTYSLYMARAGGKDKTPVPVIGRPIAADAVVDIQERLDEWRYAAAGGGSTEQHTAKADGEYGKTLPVKRAKKGRIIAERVPVVKGVGVCVQHSEAGGCRAGSGCKFTHDEKLSEEMLSWVRGGKVKPEGARG